MLGFIGTGNMASAIIKGVVSSSFLPGEKIAVYDKDTEKAKKLSEAYALKLCSDEREIAEICDKIILSVKPDVIESVIFPDCFSFGVESVISETADILEKKNPLIISIAAGKSTQFISSLLGYEGRVIRVMPNINAVVLEAVSAYCTNENATKEDTEFAEGLLNSFGKAVLIPESKFSAFSAIGGCAPAFSYMYIDALARAGVQNGLSKEIALEVAAQTVLGSAKMIIESKEHPYELVDRVCSPGGTTIEGVQSLKKDGFEGAVANAVEASVNKDKRM